MRLSNLFYLVLIISFLVNCQDDLDGDLAHGGGMTEGMATFRFELESATEIYTRADDASANAIENVMLMVFDESNILTKSAYFDAPDGEGSVRLYLSGTDKMVYAFCNLPETTRKKLQEKTIRTYTYSDLTEEFLTISQADGAYMGNFVMSGQEDLRKGNVPVFSESYEIKVTRLAAKFDFKIYFHPEVTGDQFAITGLYLYNTPKGSLLLPNGYADVEENQQELNAGTDYVDGTGSNYFNYKENGTDAEDGYRVAYETLYDTSAGTGIIDQYYGATFYQFENRRGAVYDNYKTEKDADGNIISYEGGENWTGSHMDWTVYGGTGWNDLSSLRGQKGEAGSTFAGKDLFVEYRQINKRILAKYFDRSSSVNSGYTDTHSGFPGASFLVIEGVYRKANGDASDVKYYVYLGKDNYADFNVKRNHNYIYQVMIYTMEKYDTRVYSEALGNIKVYYDDSILDAHFNVRSALLYSQTDWTARVKNPDETPWLEISTSPQYKPRKPGFEPSPDQAQFRINGKGGLNYVYIHTDEYVPAMESPALLSPNFREGTIVFESGDKREEITVCQYAAQMVICHIKYDIHTMKEVRDTFYVERVLEKKNMAWGFEKYWSFVTDDLIAAGQWDGLANTRRLYDVALNGDKWDVAAAYPDGIPSDIALGYAIQKNRDRNGNGKIDYNEILWYLPAANEIQALSAHIYGSGVGDYYPDGTSISVEWDQDNGNFHTSSPSVADPAGITPGRSYYVTLSTGKKAIGLRSRYYNVLCARRANGWLGPNTGETEGNVDNDEDWNDEEEVIVPRN